MRIRLLSAKFCGNCKSVKKILDENNIKYEYIEYETDEGKKLAASNNVRYIPALIITTNDGQIIKITGSLNKEQINFINNDNIR